MHLEIFGTEDSYGSGSDRILSLLDSNEEISLELKEDGGNKSLTITLDIDRIEYIMSFLKTWYNQNKPSIPVYQSQIKINPDLDKLSTTS